MSLRPHSSSCALCYALIFVALFVICSLNSVAAQSCGTTVTAEQWEAELDRIRSGFTYPSAVRPLPHYRIPVAVHVVRRSDGTGPVGPCAGAPPDTLPHPGMFRPGQIDTAFADLNTMFEPLNWEFFQAGSINYIDDDDLYCLTLSGGSIWTFVSTAHVYDAVNVYFAPNTGQSGTTLSVTEKKGILVDASAAGVPENPSTLAHEMGHYFGLFHTHELRWDGTEYIFECPDGSNCETAGDLLCDTPADPMLLGGVTPAPACIYARYDATPPHCDGTPYNPLTDNLMSYAPALCRTAFTPQQIDKMIYYLENERPELAVVVTGVSDGETDPLPTTFSLSQNYPNPFNPSTRISFTLPVRSQASVAVYNTRGRRVRILLNESLPAGEHEIEWDGRTDGGQLVASGVYFYRLTAGDRVESKKMLLLK